MSPVKAGRFALRSVAAAALCVLASGSWALGLGRLQVQSALGEALRAEIEVASMTPDEAATLQVRVASPDAYRAAGLDYNAVLPGVRATLVRRPDGRAVLRLASDRAVQEPFVDVILELSWASGRLVREYTLLLDPPRIQPAPPAQAAAPVTAPVTTPAPPAPAPLAATRPPAAPAPAAPRAAAPAAAAVPAPRPAPVDADQVTVRRGDTLSRIATRTAPQGVSLEQMLVSLYRANPHAFIENNMNLLRAGSVLAVPRSDAVAQVPRDEALQVIRAQSEDFNAYRQRLAGVAPALRADEPARRATGTVQASVEERTPSAAAPDQLKLSQGTVQPGAAEARLSREAEQREASTRVAELSRNVEELERLQQAARPQADASQPAATVAAASAASAAVLTPAAPVVAAAPAPAPAAPATEPGFVETLLDNPLVLPGAGVLIALLAGLGIYRLRRKSPVDSGETSFLESKIQPDSFFGATGGQRVDTREAAATGAPSSMSYSLSQLDAIGDVDPVAEADVYLAYGRDLQAEEILKEAMRANPERLAIRSKLLEVYAKRRDTKGFEALATQLYGLTRGEGEDWLKAQELGRQIDPDNALYRAGGKPAGGAVAATTAAAALGATTMPQSVLPTPSAYAAPDSRQPIEPLAPMDVELDLDLNAPPPPGEPLSAPMPLMETTQPLTPSIAPDSQLDFEIPVDDMPPPRAEAASPAAAPFDLGSLSLDLDAPGPANTLPGALEPPMLDFGTLTGAKPVELPPEDDDEIADPLQRKLELAEEFRQIGDVEGARDLLEEVVAKGGDALKAKAQAMLDDLA